MVEFRVLVGREILQSAYVAGCILACFDIKNQLSYQTLNRRVKQIIEEYLECILIGAKIPTKQVLMIGRNMPEDHIVRFGYVETRPASKDYYKFYGEWEGDAANDLKPHGVGVAVI